MGFNIIDRRLNPGGKSVPNRQRFLERGREQVKKAVRDASAKGGVEDIGKDGKVSIPTEGIQEPTLRRAEKGGKRDYVVPGNKEYIEGDTLPRPDQSGGRGSDGSPDGEGDDDFKFVLSREEFLNIFLDDLELPDLVKQKVKESESFSLARAGYSVTGSPANLNILRTMRNGLSRRIALHRPKKGDIADLEERIKTLQVLDPGNPELPELEAELVRLVARMKRIPWIDEFDVRYNRFEQVPKPIVQAVMFCLMDVSGSMTEHMKDLSKRFFTLLYLFLERRYRNVDIVFIRHTHEAKEVDENTFFYSTETGGTVVSTALEVMRDTIKARYPESEWNIYGAQASDGDNISSDNARSASLLKDVILPTCQYFAYIEVAADQNTGMSALGRETELWRTYKVVVNPGVPLAMRRVKSRREIFPVFRELFAKDKKTASP